MKILIVSSHSQANEWLTRHIEIAWPACDYRVLRAERLFESRPVQTGGADVVVVILWEPSPQFGETRELQALTRLARADGARPVVLLTGPRSSRFTESVWQSGVAAHLELGSVTREAVLAALRAAARQLELVSATTSRPIAIDRRPLQFRQNLVPVEVLSGKALRQVTLMADPATGQQVVIKFTPWEFVPPNSRDAAFASMRDQHERLSAVAHPALEVVRSLWREDAGCVVAAEHLSGGTLGARRVAGIAPEEAVRCFIVLADGLAVLHRAGLAHGDIRASNVVFRDRKQPVWVDFAGLTPMGTKAAGAADRDGGAAIRRDLVGLGWVLHDLLVGQERALSEQPPATVPPLPTSLRWIESVFHGLVGAKGAQPFTDAAHAISVLQAMGQRRNRDQHFAHLARLANPPPTGTDGA